jgi:AcrR family transcriptional regulator
MQAKKTRDRILDAAEDLFASQGYQATTIAQVAKVVGVKGPALYKHFSSKNDLFEEVLERLFAPFAVLLQDAEHQGETQQAIMQQHLANPNVSRIVQHATLSGGEALEVLVQRWYLPFFHHTREMLASGAGPFTPVSVMAMHSMLLGYLTLAPLHQAIFDVQPLSAAALEELVDLQGALAKLLQQNP